MKRWTSAAVLLTVAMVGCGTNGTNSQTGSGSGSAAATTPATGDVTLVKLKLPGMT